MVDPTRIQGGSAFAAQAAGLVAAYGFNETGGSTVLDRSGFDNGGRLGRGVTRSGSGRFGRALRFNGGGFVTIPNASSLQLTTGMTLEAWVNPTVIPNRWVDVIYKGRDNYYLMASTDRNMVPAGGGIFNGGPGTTRTYGPDPLPVNTWSHLAATYDGASIRLYLNGTEVSSAARTGALATSNRSLTIGGDSFFGQYFTGLIDEVRVYNRALSPEEIQADMAAPVDGDTQAPTVAITSPTTAATYSTTASSLAIAGTSSDNISVAEVTWSASTGAAGTATGTTTWSANVPLQAGSNVVTVTARDAANNVATATLTVTRSVSGLVAAYGFDETSGTTVSDGSGFGGTGTLGTGITRSTSGRFGSALNFSGTGLVTIPNTPSVQLTSEMTLEAWVRPTVVPTGWVDVMNKGKDNYYLMASTDRTAPAGGGIFNNEASTTKSYGTSALPLNTWSHLAATYDGTTIRLYLNGTEVSSVPRTGSILTQSDALTIGGDPFYGQYFRGTIDEVRIYNRALTASQIATDMNTPISGAAPDPVTLNITSPTTSATYHTAATTISIGGTSSGSRVKRITWTNSRGGSGTAVGTTDWSAGGIALQTGTNDLTVVARDSVDGPLANASLSVTVDEPPPATPTQLFIQTQPSSTAQSGVPFAQQPVIQLRDASNNPVSKSGVAVSAAIASGGGSLGGTTVVSTNASGVATFTNLQITGTAGSRTLSFSSSGLTSATSTAIAVSDPAPAGLYPNRPASYTRSSEIDFSQSVPTGSDQIDQPIAGTSWNMIYYGGNWTKATDASAPQSAPGIWQGRWAPGSYGGGVIGQGGGHGIGNVFTRAPSGTSRLYMSMRVYFDFDASLWHPISNKFVNLEGDHSQILMQLREGGDWRHAEELGSSGFSSFWVDNRATSGETHLAGQVDNRAVPNRRWVQIEVLIDLPNRVFKIWQDGVLTTNATPNFASTEINTVGIYAYRGGGGETLNTELFYKYDHFFIAW
jgi:hypothetical protein